MKSCNSSLEHGVFPEPWKRANIIPLKKTTVLSSCSYSRPIAILSFLFKILEKIVHAQISEYLEEILILFYADRFSHQPVDGNSAVQID